MRFGLLLGAVSALAGCGFSARPPSAAVACNPQGAGCCPDGYLCVGRGAVSETGVSTGTCWHKDDLPLEALVHAHDDTPGFAGDPPCLVTDWVPTALPGDAGAVEEPIPPGGDIDAAAAEDASESSGAGEG